MLEYIVIFLIIAAAAAYLANHIRILVKDGGKCEGCGGTCQSCNNVPLDSVRKNFSP
jgi:hypothetical protein